MKHDGGPAFPRPASEFTASGTCPDGNDPRPDQQGMTMREFYAALAMQGILASGKSFEAKLKPGEVAEGAFNIADAMLAQAKK